MMTEIFLVEIGEVNGVNIGNGMIAQRCLTGKAGDAAGGETVVFDIGPGYGVGELTRMLNTADPKVERKIADHPPHECRIVRRDRKPDACGGIFHMDTCKDDFAPVETVGPGFDGLYARNTGEP